MNDMKNIIKQNKNIIVKYISVFVVIISIIVNFIIPNSFKSTNTANAINLQSVNEYNLEEDIVSFINENNEKFNFYANIFGISISDLKESIINDNINNRFNENNIGNTKAEYDSFDKNIIDYLYNLRKTNSKLFNTEYSDASIYSKEYIYGLINYFSNIYDVDYDILASIAYIESGNLNSKYMLKSNNIYGGMSSKGLIKHNNIEMGVLSYVKMMANGYYAKGLNTVETIAKKYNSGSTSWINKVNKYKNVFDNSDTIDIYTLVNLK